MLTEITTTTKLELLNELTQVIHDTIDTLETALYKVYDQQLYKAKGFRTFQEWLVSENIKQGYRSVAIGRALSVLDVKDGLSDAAKFRLGSMAKSDQDAAQEVHDVATSLGGGTERDIKIIADVRSNHQDIYDEMVTGGIDITTADKLSSVRDNYPEIALLCETYPCLLQEGMYRPLSMLKSKDDYAYQTLLTTGVLELSDLTLIPVQQLTPKDVLDYITELRNRSIPDVPNGVYETDYVNINTLDGLARLNGKPTVIVSNIRLTEQQLLELGLNYGTTIYTKNQPAIIQSSRLLLK